METEKYYFRVGIFFLMTVAVFVYYLLVFGGAGQESKNLVRYGIYFDSSVSGLARGAPVKLKGIEVGLVRDIQFASRASDRILVTADIVDTAPIQQDTIASIEFQGITGATYLSLQNVRPDLPPAKLKIGQGEKYPTILSARSDFQQVLSSAPEVLGKLSKTADQAQKLLSDDNVVALSSLLNETSGAMREIKMLARTIREDPSVIIRGSKYQGYKVPQ